MIKIYGNQALAEAFKITTETLRVWEKNFGEIPSKKEGKNRVYELSDVLVWQSQKIFSEFEIGDDGQVYNYEAERARLTHHQANKTQLEELEMLGQLVRTDAVKKVVSDMTVAFKSKVLSIPTKCAGLLVTLDQIDEIENLLKQQIHESLEELHTEQLERITSRSSPSHGGGDSTAA